MIMSVKLLDKLFHNKHPFNLIHLVPLDESAANVYFIRRCCNVRMKTVVKLKIIIGTMTVNGDVRQTYQLTRARRVRPAFESQTRLTRSVAENPLEMVDW